MTKRCRVTAEEVAEAFMMGQEYPDDLEGPDYLDDLEDPDDLEEPTLEEDPDDLEPMMEGSDDEFSIVLGEEESEDISDQEERDDENLDPPEMDHSPPIQQHSSVLDSPAPIQQSPTTPPLYLPHGHPV